jgi:hypothetical protein
MINLIVTEIRRTTVKEEAVGMGNRVLCAFPSNEKRVEFEQCLKSSSSTAFRTLRLL